MTNKLLKYYLHLFEIAKSSLDINGETKLTENKIPSSFIQTVACPDVKHLLSIIL